MTLKKIGSLLLATLMVVGLSSTVSAQTILGDNDGVRIRVVNPATGEFAGINDRVSMIGSMLRCSISRQSLRMISSSRS